MTIDAKGQVKLTYSNSKTELLGAIAIADFRNPQAMERIGDGLFENRGSGERRCWQAPGRRRQARLQADRSVERRSPHEFGDLILIQRGFQASSQVVSVSNDMIQQLFGDAGQG